MTSRFKVFFFLVDGGWSEWEAWGECLKPCGVSRSIRRRTCDKPEPKYRGKPCNSSQANETRECNLTKCTGKHSKIKFNQKYVGRNFMRLTSDSCALSITVRQDSKYLQLQNQEDSFYFHFFKDQNLSDIIVSDGGYSRFIVKPWKSVLGVG